MTFRPTLTFDPTLASPSFLWQPEGYLENPDLLSWGLLPFSALEMGSDLHRAYLTRLCCALRFFQPLNALIPPASVTALFHAAYALGILPFRAFPLPKAVTPLDARYPHDVT
jgi:hypothetical protein